MGELTIHDSRRRLHPQAQNATDGSGDYPRPLRAGPYDVYADPNGKSWTLKSKGVFVLADTDDGFKKDGVFHILAGLRIADHLDNPST